MRLDDGDDARRRDARAVRARATRTPTRAATTRGDVVDAAAADDDIDDDAVARPDATRRRRRDDDATTTTRDGETTRAREDASGRRRARERGRATRRRRRLGTAAAAATAALAATVERVGVDASTALTKGVARNGFVSSSGYKYYKVNVACVEAAQPLTLELTTSNGDADLYVSRSAQPTTSSYEQRSVNVGNALDSVTITSPVNGYYYVSVYGALSSTYKLRALTTMFTGKHPCTGFRITDSDVSSVGSGSGNQFILQEALTASAAAGFTADVSVDGDVILGDAYTDSVTAKGELKLGVTDSTYYAITRQSPSAPSSNPGGALSIVGANATYQGGSVKILGGTGGSGAGGDVVIEAGSASGGNGGDLKLRGGTSNSGTGGDVVIDAGDSTTQASSYEGIIHIGPTSASFVRVGESSNKQVQTDIFGDLTVHGNLLTTNDVVYANSYTSYVQVSTSQDGMFHQEVRAPKITGLDAEDITGTPTSTLTLDAGMRGSQQHVVIAPSEATAVYIGSSTSTIPVSIRQGANAGDVRVHADGSGALSVTSAAGQDLTLASGDDVVVTTAASKTLALKQDSTSILSWDAAGAVTVNSVSGQDLTLSTGGSAAVTVDSTGQVGIGTTTPGQTLDVTGTARVSGATTLSSTLGVSGATTLASVGVTGAATVGGTLGVTGATTLTGDVTMSNDLTVSGALTVTSDAAVSLTSASGSDVRLTSAGTGHIVLTSTDDITLDAADNVTIDAAGALSLAQGGTSILSWTDTGAVTLNSLGGQTLSVSSLSSAGNAGAVSVSGGTTTGTSSNTGGDLTLQSGGAPAGSVNGDVLVDSATGLGTAGSITLRQGVVGERVSVDANGAVSLDTHSGQDLTLSTGGSAAVTVDSTGQVGIGLTNPNQKLHLLGTGTGSTPKIRFETLNNGNDQYTVDGTEIGGIQFGADDYNWATQHMSSEIVGIHRNPTYAGARGDLVFKTSDTQGSDPTEKMRIRYDGNVGIGTASPGYELDVVGDINFSGNLYQGGSLFGSSPWTESSGNVYRSSGNVGIGQTNPTYNLHVAGTGRVSTTLSVGQDLTIDTAGDLNFAASHRQMINLRVGAEGFGIGTQMDTTYFRSPGHFAFYEDGTHSTTDLDANGGTARLVIRSGGKMGIGRTDPSYDLDVVGDINFSGNLYKGGSLFPSPSPWTESGSNVYRSSGNVGIGLTNPSYKLDVTGTGHFTGATTIDDQLTVGGNVLIQSTTNKISFGSTARQFIETNNGGIGTQSKTLYFRSQDFFGFYKNGGHNSADLNPGGSGTLLVAIRGDISGPRMAIGSSDTDSGYAFKVTGSAQATAALDVGTTLNVASYATIGGDLRLNTGTQQINFGTQHRQVAALATGGIGTQTNTVYFRSQDLFGFYKGGGHSSTALDPGGSGTLLVTIRGDVSGPRLGVGVTNPSYALEVNGAAHVSGALSKGSGSFKIDHPLPEMKDTHNLYHSFIEGPRADLIYRGKVRLQNGRAMIDIDAASNMTTGTFEALNRDVQSFTSNESDWDPVRGSVVGNVLTIECQNPTSTALISWLVIGERHDQHMYDTDWTDENGRVVPEQLKKSATT